MQFTPLLKKKEEVNNTFFDAIQFTLKIERRIPKCSNTDFENRYGQACRVPAHLRKRCNSKIMGQEERKYNFLLYPNGFYLK